MYFYMSILLVSCVVRLFFLSHKLYSIFFLSFNCIWNNYLLNVLCIIIAEMSEIKPISYLRRAWVVQFLHNQDICYPAGYIYSSKRTVSVHHLSMGILLSSRDQVTKKTTHQILQLSYPYIQETPFQPNFKLIKKN